jgi:flagellar hook-basal body complex protein FliE
MSDVTINSILSQIRNLQSQATSRVPFAAEPAASSVKDSSFGDSLRRAISTVNEEQKQAQGLAGAFERGDANVSLSGVMLAQQSAQLSFRATVEMRNRLVQAYQDVMNMPL